MGYVNFKEERYKANNQLEKRKHNNETLYNFILKHKDTLSGYLPSEKFSFHTFEGNTFGKKGVLGEEDFHIIYNEDIVCSKFIDCNFTNVKFLDCRFVACAFDNCELNGGGVVFENCIMVKEDSDKLPSLNRKDNLSSSFYNCSIYAKFLNCDISFLIMEECKIMNTSFEQTAMNNMIMNKCELNMVTFEDCDFSGGKIISTYIVDLNFNDKYRTKLDEKNFFDTIQPRIKDKQEYEGIYMTYQTLANKFKENSLINNFGEYYYLTKRTENKCVSLLIKIRQYIYWLTCGYGERPQYALLSGLGIILIFSVIYLFTGVDINGEEVRYTLSTISTLSLQEFLKHINETITLSVGTFAGLGVINCQPTEISYIFANIEVVIGVIMMGLGIGTLTRKIVR